jgi:hypothetical protein
MFKKLIMMAAAVPLLAACGKAIAPSGTTAVKVMLTDAPGDFVSAVVTIDSIYLQGDNGGTSSGRVWLSQTPVTTDLLTLANDVSSLVDNVEVPSGNYAQLRFVIGGGYVEVENSDGSTSIYATPNYDQLPPGKTADGTLQMPSYGTSGLKVTFDGGTVDVSGAQKVILVDFDVAQSFGQVAGGSGGWVMNPVIRGADMQLTASTTVTLSLADSVTLPQINGTQLQLSDFSATLDDGQGNTKQASFASVNGVFTASFPYLMPGTTWTLQVAGPTGLTFTVAPALPIQVTPSSGQDSHFDLVITSAAPTP